MSDTARAHTVAWGSPRARWVLAAAVLGSGMAFLDGTIVNVALPAMARDLDADLADLQWVLDAYLVTLTALVLLGGALGDRFGRRRVFTIGVGAFAVASVLCGVAPTTGALIAARVAAGSRCRDAGARQPGAAVRHDAPRGSRPRDRCVVRPHRRRERGRDRSSEDGSSTRRHGDGRSSSTCPSPSSSWSPARRVPESTDPDAPAHLDLLGATIVALGLASLTAGLIEAGAGWTVLTVAAVIAGVALLGAFVVVERRSPAPMLPPALFRSRQFTGANLVTLAVYAGLGGAFFFVVVNLQDALGYSALESGAALTPVTVVMLLLSSRMGAMSQRTGPRLPMTVGPAIVALGLLLLGQIEAGRQVPHYGAPRGARLRARALRHRCAAHRRCARRRR